MLSYSTTSTSFFIFFPCVYYRKEVKNILIRLIIMNRIITFIEFLSKNPIKIGPKVVAKAPEAETAPTPKPDTLVGKSSTI